MRRYALIVGLLLAASSHAQPVRMHVEYGGTRSGFNNFDLAPDGTFTSVTELNLGTLRIASDVKGKFEDGRLVEFVANQENPGAPKINTVFSAGKAKITAGPNVREFNVTLDRPIYVGNLHPQLTVSLLKAADFSKKEPQTITAMMVETASVFPAKVTPKGQKSIAGGAVQQYQTEFGAVVVDFSLTDRGVIAAMDVPSQKLRFVAEHWEGLFVDPLIAYPELSQPTFRTIAEPGVKMKTRDGVELVADVIRPEAPGKYPVILSRTPYGRASASVDGAFYASRGYVFVAQDCRGRGDSGGEWDPFVNERKDGYDTVDWAAKQSWSNGSIGMIGASYGGLVQWAAAVEKHPALKCMIPQVSPPDAMRNIPYDMGTFFLYGNLWWGKIVREKNADFSSMMGPLPHPEKFNVLPLSKTDDAVLGYNVPFYDKWLERETIGQWKGFDWSAEVGKVTVPALHVSGWWDGDLIGTQTNWASLRKAGRTNQWLLYGPWTHAFNTTSTLGDVDYGPTAILELDSLYLRWFDTWLKEKSVGMDRVPKVRAFVTGANKWIEMEDWPSTKSTEKTLYLFADKPANGKASHGELRDRPATAQEPSRYIFNPAEDWIPQELITMDPSKATTVIELGDESNGTLVFKTAPFVKPTAIGGPIDVSLKFQSSAKDTDFFAMLVDIDPQGKMRQILRSGKIRASYLGGYDKRRLLTPGKTYTADIQLWDVAHEFQPGHRMGLLITSGMFPMYDRNLGTGEPIKDATRMVVQANTILHDAKNASTLKFRVLW